MDFNELILKRLQERNEREQMGLTKLITSNARLLSTVLQLKAQCQEFQKNEEVLREENLTLKQRKSTSIAPEEHQQELQDARHELMTLLRERGEKNQDIINLNNKLQENEKQLTAKELEILKRESQIEELAHKNSTLEGQVDELTATNQMLKDEQQALQLEFVCLQDKYNKLNQEHDELIQRWLTMMNQVAEKQNREMEDFIQKKQAKVENELKSAIEQKVFVSPSPAPTRNRYMCMSVPSKALHSFEAHDGEVNDVKWTPSNRLFATAGSDRRVKLWEIVNNTAEKRGMLTGSNGGVMSIDFDGEPESMLLAGSNDFACHIWNVEDHRHRHTLTGHSSKVFCSKFMEDSTKVVSGSHDRTLKLWDLKERACIRTMFAGSSCNSLVTIGTLVISGHFDKKVRFWDRRAEQPSNEITLHGRITSLDLSTDCNKLLCSTREPSLKMIDLRMNQVVSTFTAAAFQVGADYSKAIFSPDSEYVCSGSADGSVFIWNVNKNKVEKVLKEHTHTVLSCSWSPYNGMLLTCDNRKKVILWSDF